ncbi:MAG: hypothetical protein DRI22_01495 [Caldiserica bacterium]|nr:MAG: hypothetical protein DRI22_01495 [Caldisericota bacterium]
MIIFICGMLFAGLNLLTPFVNVTVKGVPPGKKFSLAKNGYPKLRVYNKGKEKVIVRVNVVSRGQKVESRIIVEREVFEIEPGSFSETDLIIFVPKRKENYGKRFEREILITGRTEKGNVQGGLRSKIVFYTTKKKSFFQWLKELLKGR